MFPFPHHIVSGTPNFPKYNFEHLKSLFSQYHTTQPLPERKNTLQDVRPTEIFPKMPNKQTP